MAESNDRNEGMAQWAEDGLERIALGTGESIERFCPETFRQGSNRPSRLRWVWFVVIVSVTASAAATVVLQPDDGVFPVFVKVFIAYWVIVVVLILGLDIAKAQMRA